MAVHRRDPNPARKVHGNASEEGWTETVSHLLIFVPAVFLCGAALAAFRTHGLWLPLILAVLRAAQVLVVGGRRAKPWLPDHPLFHDLFDGSASRKRFTFTYFTLLAFVVMASVAVWGGVQVHARCPDEPGILLMYAGLSLAFVLIASLVVGHLQLPGKKREAEEPTPRRRRTRRRKAMRARP